ncbi:MAG: glycosyltransferase, partial [Bdellovibrionota bacterium]
MNQKREPLAVAVVTFHRARQLERCLRSLVAAGRASRFELHTRVAVNGSDPESHALLERLSADEPDLALAVLAIDSPCTPSAARNRLLVESNQKSNWLGHSSWICFLDDDAFVDPQFLEQFARAREALPEAVSIGGPNLTPPGASFFSTAAGLALSSRLATFLSFARYRPRGPIRFTDENELALCNLFFRLDTLGPDPFPEALFCGEENWLLSRLEKQGHRLVYDPDLKAWHDRRASPGSLGLQIYRYGKGRGENLLAESFRIQSGVRLVPLACLIWTLTEA